jgi:oligoendopeptidase F
MELTELKRMLEFSRRQALTLALAASASPAALLAEAVDPSSRWDLSALFASDADWQAEAASIPAALRALEAGHEGFGRSASGMADVLEAGSRAALRTVRVFLHASLRADEDLRVAANVERRDVAQGLLNRHAQATAWIRPSVVALGAERVKALVGAEPRLMKFRFGLENHLRLADHVLDPASESLLALATPTLDGPAQIRQLLLASDLPWPILDLAHGRTRIDLQSFGTARSVDDREERQRVVEAFFGTLGRYQSTFGATLGTRIRGDVFRARARRYPTALAAAMDEPNIPAGVYSTLVAEVNRGLPLLHRYFDLRRRALGLTDLHYHDISAPLTKSDLRYDIATARRLTLEAVQPLGREYVDALARHSNERWVDVYPRTGKRESGYANGSAYGVHPYVLMNFTGDYFSLSTYAHEWGHAMHFVLAGQSQPYETYPVSTFAAEIPSTTNEQLLLSHMLRNAKAKPERLFYLDRICESIRTSLFGQTMYAEFELAIHKVVEDGGSLTGERLSAMWLEINQRYHGSGVTIDPVIGSGWSYILHFYLNFYVYQYSTSVTAASLLAERIGSGDAVTREAYLGMLRAGGSRYPVELLQECGVDLTSAEPYRRLLARFAHTMDEMERLIGAP